MFVLFKKQRNFGNHLKDLVAIEKIKNQRAVQVGIIQNLLEITLQLFCYFFQLEMHSSIFRRKISLFFSLFSIQLHKKRSSSI